MELYIESSQAEFNVTFTTRMVSSARPFVTAPVPPEPTANPVPPASHFNPTSSRSGRVGPEWAGSRQHMTCPVRSLLLLCGALPAAAWHAGSVHRPIALSRRAMQAAPTMVAVEPLAQAAQLAAPHTVAELPMPSLLLGEGIFDVLAGIAGSPIILLVPIGAGTLVALGIIWVLVKSAEPGKPSS